ncbi:MAG TPA: hypothetical protein VH331_13450 [Allosphingosinicella sp.]|nr:hypothetical protein [Allosphingosinicella sp.]
MAADALAKIGPAGSHDRYGIEGREYMVSGYEEPQGPRFRVAVENGREEIRVPAQRSWPLLLFLIFWLAMWTVGGCVAIYQLITTHELFLALWLCAWAVGWVFAAGTIAWMIAGAEILNVSAGDLEIGWRVLRFGRTRRYRGTVIRALSPASGNELFRRFQFNLPFLTALKSGAMKFDYGARTIYCCGGLDEAEGRLIVDLVRKRLPAPITDQVSGPSRSR